MAEIVAYVYRVNCPMCGTPTDVRSDWTYAVCMARPPESHRVYPPVVDRNELPRPFPDPLVAIAQSLETIASCVRTSAAYEGREDIHYLRTEP